MSDEFQLPDPRTLLVRAVHEEHVNRCGDLDCKCHETSWYPEFECWASKTVIAEADAILEEIKDNAVREYRGV